MTEPPAVGGACLADPTAEAEEGCVTDDAPDWRDEFDDNILEMWEEALRNGLPPEQLMERLGEASKESARPVTDDLVRRAPQSRQDLDAVLDSARHAVANRWSHALDLFAALALGVDEVYGDYHRRRAQDDGADEDHTFWVLAGLTARAVRTANEVYVLLQAGLPSGAIARARTMHEIAVIAGAIGGSRDANVAERYIDHALVESYRRMKLYQRHAADLGYPPFGDAEIKDAKRVHDEVRAKHGRGFSGPYGWAVPLFEDKPNPGIGDLEELLDMTRMRPWRKWADHEIHPTSHGSMLNLLDDHEGRHRITGPVETGLADPAQVALIALVQTLTVAVVHGDTEHTRPTDLTVLAAATQLLDHALEAFARVERESTEEGDRPDEDPTD